MFLEKLDKLIEERKINKNILATESGIPYTTIMSFYQKGYDNMKLSTLSKLCDYFGVTLDYFIRDNPEKEKSPITHKGIELTEQSMTILKFFQDMTPEKQAVYLEIVQAIAKLQKL